MRLIVLFFLSFGAFAQAQDSSDAAENVAAQRQGALTALYGQVYGEAVMEGEEMNGEAFEALVQNLATCTYGEQHEASAVVDGLERVDCGAVLQMAFDGGVSNNNVQNAIEQASQSVAAQNSVVKP